MDYTAVSPLWCLGRWLMSWDVPPVAGLLYHKSGALRNANKIDALYYWWAGQRSRYSDWLRPGRSGDRIPVGGEILRTCPVRSWGPPSFLYNGYRVFPGGKERPRRDADPSPHLVPLVMKEYSYTSTPPMGRTACTEPQCLHKGALYLFFLLSIVKSAVKKFNKTHLRMGHEVTFPSVLTLA